MPATSHPPQLDPANESLTAAAPSDKHQPAQPGIFDLLFKVIDGPHAEQLAPLALPLLQTMPTSPALAAEVRAGLEQQEVADATAEAPRRQAGALQQALTGGEAGSSSISSKDGVARPFQVLYRLEALAALLFPAVQDLPGAAAAAAQARSRGEGGDERAANGGGDEDGGGGTAAGASGPAGRRALQERFLSAGGLEVVCGLVDQLSEARAGDVALLRELGQLAVVLIHSLIDATTPRPSGPAAAAAAAPSTATSAAESAPVGPPRPGSAPDSGAAAGGDAANGDSPMVDAAAAATPGGAPAVLGSSSTATPLADPAAPMDADQPSQEDPAAAEPPAPPPGAKLLGAAAGAALYGADDKLHPPDQHHQPHPLPPRPQTRPAQQQQQQQQPPRPPGSAPLEIDGAVLRLMSSTLPRLAVRAARLWGAPASAAAYDDDGGPDVLLVREALALTQRVLELRPELLAPLLAPAGGGDALVPDLLLNPHYSVVRAVAEDFVGRVCCSAAEPLDWLLRQLAEARPLAAERPGVSGEFYSLFSRAVRALQAVERVPQGAFARAEGLLADEVAFLRGLPPGGGDAQQVALQVGRRVAGGWRRSVLAPLHPCNLPALLSLLP